MENLQYLITQWGYVGIFVLLVLGIVAFPIPDESLLATAGFLVHQGKLAIVPTVFTAICGCLCGITVSYILGRTIGFSLIVKYGRILNITEEKIQRAHNWFEHAGKWLLVFGYYIPGIRHLSAFVAGTSKLEFPVFAMFAYSGGFIWSVGFLTAGYFLGEGWERISQEIHHYLVMILELMIALLLLALLILRVKKRRSTGR